MDEDIKFIAKIYSALGNENIFAILKFLEHNQRQSFTGIRNVLFEDSRKDNGSLSYCLKKMLKVGLIHKVKREYSQYGLYEITQRGKTVLENTDKILKLSMEQII